MKSLIIVIIFVVTLFAKQHSVNNDLTWKYWNDVWKTYSTEEMSLKYDNDEDMWYLYFYGVSTYALSFKNPTELLGVISKYKEWNITASQNNVEIMKEISSINDGLVWWKTFDDWNNSSQNIKAMFMSWSPQRHAFVLAGNVTSRTNSYRSKVIQITLDWNQVIDLEKALSPESLERYKVDVIKQIETEAMFK